jgi:predicted enzyme related to lactoylglutathione lyase
MLSDAELVAFIPTRDLDAAKAFYGSLLERLAALRSAGVSATRYDGMEQDDDGVWMAPSGTQVAWFMDPDGNTLSLQQDPAT